VRVDAIDLSDVVRLRDGMMLRERPPEIDPVDEEAAPRELKPTARMIEG